MIQVHAFYVLLLKPKVSFKRVVTKLKTTFSFIRMRIRWLLQLCFCSEKLMIVVTEPLSPQDVHSGIDTSIQKPHGHGKLQKGVM